jgi:predicted HTH transcriptional regulator
MSPVDLDRLLREEGAHVEWKRRAADVAAVVKTLSAFANDLDGSGTGGWVVCGIEEGRDEHGFALPRQVGLAASRLQEVKGKVLAWCRERVSPPILPVVEEIPLSEDPSRRILTFYVSSSLHAHAFREQDGSTRYWVRHGSETVDARGELLRVLQQGKTDVPPFLQRPCPGATLADLDLFAAESFLGQADLPQPPAEYLKPGARLDAFSHPLVVSQTGAPGESRPVPTYLAVLLFSREPTRFIPGAYAVLSVYDGVSRTDDHSTRFQATGPLPSLIRDLIDRLQLYTGTSIDKSASAVEIQQNRPRYSLKALQEAVVNAFAHRDYESHEPVRITVFSDRIEIVSPGGPNSGSDPDRLRKGDAQPLWRNPSLASFLLKLQLAQAVGQGLGTIFRETLATSGREPQILLETSSFEVTLPAFQPGPRGERKPGLGGRQGLVLISIGGKSIRSVVEHSLPNLGLEDAEFLVDFTLPEYVSPDIQHWEAEAARIRDQIREWVENPRFVRLHLFYRGPVVIAPLLGALIAPAKPLVVYHYEDGQYRPAYTLDRRFLIGKD